MLNFKLSSINPTLMTVLKFISLEIQFQLLITGDSEVLWSHYHHNQLKDNIIMLKFGVLCIIWTMQMTWKEVVTHKNLDSAKVLITTLARGYACNLCIREVDLDFKVAKQNAVQYIITSRSKNNRWYWWSLLHVWYWHFH